MNRPAKLKLFSFISMVLLIMGLVVFFPYQGARKEPGNPTPQSSDQISGQETSDQSQLEAAQGESLSTVWRQGARSEASTVASKARPKTEFLIPPNVTMGQYKAELWAQIQAEPPELEREEGSPIDAELAYRLYMYYGNCSMAPRYASQVDTQLDRIVDRAEKARERYLDRLEGRANQIMDYYELCLPIPPDVDRRLEAVYWMSKAVQLGHEVAEVQYYEKAMGFILRPDRYSNSPPLAMQYPDLVAEFKSTARLGLTRALEKGHPEAYLAQSRAILEGLIYPRDAFLAFAYARAAELEAARNHIILNNSSERKREAAQYLSQEQLNEAEQLALELPLRRNG